MAESAVSSYTKVHGASMEVDWQRVNALASLLDADTEATTARPLHCDPERRTITYEYLSDLRPLMRLPEDLLFETLARIGRSLAKVHMRAPSTLPSATASEKLPLTMLGIDDALEHRVNEHLPTGFFYGDCWHGNIFLGPRDTCVFLDPVQSPWMFGRRNFFVANGIVDLATLHMSLLISHPLLRLLRRDTGSLRRLGDELLEHYLATVGAKDCREDVLAVSRRVAEIYISVYPRRINFVVGSVKAAISRARLDRLAQEAAW